MTKRAVVTVPKDKAEELKKSFEGTKSDINLIGEGEDVLEFECLGTEASLKKLLADYDVAIEDSEQEFEVDQPE